MPLFGRYDKMESLLKSGVLYGYQRDSQNRPMIYYSIKRAIDLGMSESAQLDTLDFIASYTIQHAMVPGKVETYNFVIDLAGVSLMESPINMLRGMANRLRIGYKLRVHNIIITNADWKITFACNFVWKLLDQHLTDKIKVFSDNGASYLTKIAS